MIIPKVSSLAQNGDDFKRHYTLQRKLISGSYGTVFIGVHNVSKDEFAIKVVDRSKLNVYNDYAQLREVEILRCLTNEQKEGQQNHSQQFNGIINLIDFYSSLTTYHIVMEYARGGDVFDQLSRRKVYNEKDARDLAREMLESIVFLHERGIAHRDIKPENLLIMDEISDTSLRLGDFGFARRFPLSKPEESMATKCGTPSFVPPELLIGVPYGPKCDVWSAGCTLYALLSGRLPFSVSNETGGTCAMFYKIRAGDFTFYDSHWSNISINARKMVLSMMQVDPNIRVSPKEALESEWMRTKDDVLLNSNLSTTLTEIVSFNARRKLKGAIGAVMIAVGTNFWDIGSTAFWRENVSGADSTIDGDSTSEDAVSSNSDCPLTFDKLYRLDTKVKVVKNETVWHGISIKSKKSYVIKVVDRKEMTLVKEGLILNEVAILKSVRHSHFVNLIDFAEDPQHFYLVMQKCSGGDVLDRVISLRHYSEKDARELSRGLLSAVEYMHDRGIAHRNLKPQNLLLESNSDNTSIKITNFGYAKRVHVPNSLTTLCGTIYFVAPELLKNHPYDESADMWSVGVILYFLLAGKLPFKHKDQSKLCHLIRHGQFNFPLSDWAKTSDESISLISSILVVDPSCRFTAKQALQSDWIKLLDDNVLNKRNLLKSQSSITDEASHLNDPDSASREVQWLNKENLSNLSIEDVDKCDSS